MNRPEARYQVDFPVFLSWQDRQGVVHRTSARCLDLSASGAHVETIDPLTPQSSVLVTSEVFGRMGHATVRYCARRVMKYKVGLQFSSALGLSDGLRQRIVQQATRTGAQQQSLVKQGCGLAPKMPPVGRLDR